MKLPAMPTPIFAAQARIAETVPDASYYTKYRGMEKYYLPTLWSMVKAYPTGRVLDIGPGWGTMAVALAHFGHQVTVMDRVPVGEFISPRLLAEHGLHYVQADIEEGPLAHQYDLILMTQVLPHLCWRPDRAIQNLARMLDPQGSAVLTALDRPKHPHIRVPYAHWRDVPEYQTAPRPIESVKCMYDGSELQDLLAIFFADAKVWTNEREKCLFATARAVRPERREP